MISRKLPTSFTLWFTGIPCSGKSTLARMAAQELRRRKIQVELLDGNELRTTLCRDLGFSTADRNENVSRIGWICSLLARHGIVTAAAVVSPYREARDAVRKMIPNFIEIYVKAPLAVCIQRDVKGLYAKALAGEIPHFTGVSDPYEEPIKAEIVLETSRYSAIECTGSILRWLENAQLIRRTR